MHTVLFYSYDLLYIILSSFNMYEILYNKQSIENPEIRLF